MAERRWQSSPELREALLAVLRDCRGREQALRVDGLRERLPMAVTRRDVQVAISELVARQRVPVCSDSCAGYWLPATADEARRAARELRRRSIAGLVRASRLLDSSGHELGGQLSHRELRETVREEMQIGAALAALGEREEDEDGE